MNKKNLRFMLMLALGSACMPAMASNFAATAFHIDKNRAVSHPNFMATGNTQKEAEEAAMRLCKESHAEGSCVIRYSRFIQRAYGGKAANLGIVHQNSNLTEQEEIKGLLKDCKDKRCKLLFSRSTPGFYAWFKIMDKDRMIDSFVVDGIKDPKNMLINAKKTCERINYTTCEYHMSGSIPGDMTNSVPLEPTRSPFIPEAPRKKS